MAITVTNDVIKMPSEGDTITMHVVKCEVVEGKYGEQVKFTNPKGAALYISRETADRQLGRCGFVDEEMVIYGDVDGNTLCFTRDKNKNDAARPYWGIRRIVSDDAPRPSLTAAAKAEAERVRKAKGLPKDEDGSLGPTIPGLDGPDFSEQDDAYLASLAGMDDDGLPPKKVASAPMGLSDKETNINAAYARAWGVAETLQEGVGTPESIQAGAATLLIAYRQAGVC